ncbi:SgcJ/EcaC family oxidoreductase [Kibdelosporangium aridum]|uniref:SgcJ/EcaC family oxidoreductase n=1 Tax=Kibdelosporangium aridum TaxID=2030 RepID=A0A428ZL42_KIBAR|nr:SgcJ/EcaC family oxidoreductase [Kibdelosporangium aridum]RSM88680.1 SgcJ/EcaC family oxidoreductase [Kibdelosporangium aridum]
MRNKVRSRVGVVAGGLAATLVLVGCSTGNADTQTAPAPQLPSREDIAKQFDTWNAALATGDPNKVADLYAPDAVLLPTVSNNVRTTRAEIVDYFQTFLQSKPAGTIDEEVIKVIDADTAINTGVYHFNLTKDGKAQRVDARYTYVYELVNGKWLILNHHSSAMPEG